MKVKLEKLIIETRNDPVIITFNKFNYFWGPISTGKSTIARLLLYCFGRDMHETPAMEKEFISSKLYVRIEDHSVLIERKKRENTLTVIFKKQNSSEHHYQVSASTSQKPIRIMDQNIYSISDLIYYLANTIPPKVLQSKLKDNTKLIRLGIRDLLWYCYLDQDDMDSNFFHLSSSDHPFKQRKSKDVINSILGYYRADVVNLEKSLADRVDKQKVLRHSADHLLELLSEHNIDDTEKLLQQKNVLLKKLADIDEKIERIKTKLYLKDDNQIDRLKQHRGNLIEYISELVYEQNSIEKIIAKQTRIKNEFLINEFKSEKIHLASQTFKNLPFYSCPKCGNDIQSEKFDNACSLCKQSLDPKPKDMSFKSELHERAAELDTSINESQNELNILSDKIKVERQTLNEVDKNICDLTEANDSKFIQATKYFLNRKGMLTGEIATLEQLLPLSEKTTILRQEASAITVDIDDIKFKLQKARSLAEKDNQNIDKLKSYFLDNLKKVKFPSLENDYEVVLDSKNFYPYITSVDQDEIVNLDFLNAGSGGKKTLFKTCFALAMHRLSSELCGILPSLLIIDSPMKNIHKAENKEIFTGLYNLLHDLSDTELHDTQFIIIGSHKPPENIFNDKTITIRRFTNDINSDEPPLIPYYQGQ